MHPSNERFVLDSPGGGRLGFGTAGLMGSSTTDRGRLRLLGLAYELGVRHFDTAPLYGRGDAEAVVGKFSAAKRDTLTLATKYGLFPQAVPSYYRIFVPVARAAYHRVRSIKAAMAAYRRPRDDAGDAKQSPRQPEAGAAPRQAKKQPYDTAHMRLMLDQSLRRLKTDYLDCYLLHECSESQIDDAVVQTLESFVERGKIRAFGVATSRVAAGNILRSYPDHRWTVQLEHTVFHARLDMDDFSNIDGIITHGALNRALRPIQQHLADKEKLERWSATLKYDLSEPGGLTGLILAHAASANRDGIVLFATRKPENIRNNVSMLQHPIFRPEQVTAFYELVQSEVVGKS